VKSVIARGGEPDHRRVRAERNVDAAANDVRDRVARVRARLAEAADDSVGIEDRGRRAGDHVARVHPSATARSTSGLRRPLRRRPLKTLPGVASVIIGGNRRYAMRIWLDRDRLAAYGLTPQDIENALRRQNVELPRAGSSRRSASSPCSLRPNSAPRSSSTT
jgi:multidrug efflux pump